MWLITVQIRFLNIPQVLATAKFKVQTGITANDSTTINGQPASTLALGISGLDISSLVSANNALSLISKAINSVSTKQSALSAASTGLKAQSSSANSLYTNLENTINSIQEIDLAASQAKLQELNKQQSIDYYLVCCPR
jgi:flagellin-like hook-associated protein FlgL